ncbi:WD40 repeat-containing protein SMU1 [Zopfochytrium polystomum]|nr:WD40 repeat-containing protein SMU1 [Zopfochytrium polystomum]
MDIEAADVIRLIQQFLRENNLHRTLETLQEETTITLNAVDSVDAFTSSVLFGHWDVVLKTISTLRVPQKKLLDLYEHIVLELAEQRELGAARSLLRQTDVMQTLRERYPERYLHLEQVVGRAGGGGGFEEREAYPNNSTRQKRRQALAQSLATEVTVVPPSRLLSLLGQALKWQQSQGLLPPPDAMATTAFDLFRGVAQVAKVEEDMPPAQVGVNIKFPKKAHAESVAFSSDGQVLVTGTVDGIIEVWNYMTGKLRKDLKYQAEDNYMVMDDAVLCLAFTRDGDTLASGSQDGKIKANYYFVWKLSTGQCLRRFPTAHNQGVTALSFSKDGTQVLSASFDQTVRIHGIRSGKTIKEFRGHVSFVNDAVFVHDGSKVISASSDGTAKFWDVKTAECLATLTLHDGQAVTSGVHSATVQRVVPMPNLVDQFIVCNRSPFVYLVNLKAQVLKTFKTTTKPPGAAEPIPRDVVAVAVSAKGEYLYAVTEDRALHCFHVESGALQVVLPQVSESEVIAVAHHPFSNVLAVASDAGVVGLWKP